ncbi:MAG: hypothetical protein KDC98_21970 [Planctomycetes bacterium]|nr:hypothetical protein [Planctomycetota bacterium]
MRSQILIVALSAAATAAAQCPYYSTGSVSAGLSRFNGGEDMRLVYVDCLATIGIVDAKFGTTNNSTNLNGLPLVIAVYDDPTDDHDPHDAVLVAQASVLGGVTGGNTGNWQRYDLKTLFGNPVPATGGMFVGVSVTYPAGTNPGPGSIEFFNNIAPGTQWLATDSGNQGLSYANIGTAGLVDIQTGPGFPPGTWVIQVESGAEYRSFGTGCAGSNGTPVLAGGPTLPVLGQVAVLDASNLPSPGIADFLLLGFAMQNPALDIGSLAGTPPNGCLVQVQNIGTILLGNVNGTGSFGFGVPLSPTFAGLSILGQVLSVDPAANAAGATASNGLRVVLGY